MCRRLRPSTTTPCCEPIPPRGLAQVAEEQEATATRFGGIPLQRQRTAVCPSASCTPSPRATRPSAHGSGLIHRRRTVGPVFSATTCNDKAMYVSLRVTIALGLAATVAANIVGGGYNYRERSPPGSAPSSTPSPTRPDGRNPGALSTPRDQRPPAFRGLAGPRAQAHTTAPRPSRRHRHSDSDRTARNPGTSWTVSRRQPMGRHRHAQGVRPKHSRSRSLSDTEGSTGFRERSGLRPRAESWEADVACGRVLARPAAL
ncbi:respiratory nitrate reductase subunit gamma [Streptomyces sp. NPDC012616]|uniref:respiratory nitrate reductase subunit gamma n=1 Tax=Streptomyces sp. NPDC012616 TaxID=3364840 RepID=UPI0036E0BD7E